MQTICREDQLVLDQLPAVMVPPTSVLPRLDKNGQRLLMAREGTYLEVRRDWLYAVRRCATFREGLQVPYGRVLETIELAGRTVPRDLIEAFIAEARFVSPLEIGGIVTYDTASGEWALRMSRSVSATAAALSYEIAPLGRAERRVVDIHSHGESAAFVSEKDRKDTAGATAVVIVVGQLDRDTPDVKAYLYLHGMCMPLPWNECKQTSDCGDADTNGRIEVALDQQ